MDFSGVLFRCEKPFDIERPEFRRDRVDLHLFIGDVRHRVDRQTDDVPDANGGDYKRDENGGPAGADGGFRNASDHDSCSTFMYQCSASPLPISALTRKAFS